MRLTVENEGRCSGHPSSVPHKLLVAHSSHQLVGHPIHSISEGKLRKIALGVRGSSWPSFPVVFVPFLLLFGDRSACPCPSFYLCILLAYLFPFLVFVVTASNCPRGKPPKFNKLAPEGELGLLLDYVGWKATRRINNF